MQNSVMARRNGVGARTGSTTEIFMSLLPFRLWMTKNATGIASAPLGFGVGLVLSPDQPPPDGREQDQAEDDRKPSKLMVLHREVRQLMRNDEPDYGRGCLRKEVPVEHHAVQRWSPDGVSQPRGQVIHVESHAPCSIEREEFMRQPTGRDAFGSIDGCVGGKPVQSHPEPKQRKKPPGHITSRTGEGAVRR